MKIVRWFAVAFAVASSFAVSSCALPEPPERDLGPQSEESTIPWNRALPGEGQGALGGFSQ